MSIPIPSMDRPTALATPSSEGLRPRHQAPAATGVESDDSGASTEVEPGEGTPRPDPVDGFFEALMELDRRRVAALPLPAAHAAPGPSAFSWCKSGRGQALMAVGTACFSAGITHVFSSPARAEQAMQHLMVSGAFGLAAARHGALHYGNSLPHQHNEIWRALTGGYAAGVVAVDAVRGAIGGPRVLMPDFAYTPRTVLTVANFIGALMLSQQGSFGGLHEPTCELVAFSRQLGVASNLIMTSSRAALHIAATWLTPTDSDAPTCIEAEQWLALARHPAGAASLAVMLGAAALTAYSPRSMTGQFVHHLLPTVLVVAGYVAIAMSED